MPPGRHFLQIPGPTNVPERVLQALSQSTIDHRGAEFARLTGNVLERLRPIFQTEGPVIIYPSSATGAWEAALVNTLSPGDTVLFCANGYFASRWCTVAEGVGLRVEMLESDWRYPVNPAAVEARLAEDKSRTIRAVCLVHNETSTGVANDVAAVRAAIDQAGHDALLMVDTVSSLASMDYRHDEWGADVTIAGSQKGLMLPPGLGFNAISAKAQTAASRARCPKAYWDWQPILDLNRRGFFPYTPATNLLYGLDVALDMLLAEGLEQVFVRHRTLAEATRRAVRAWGLPIYCREPLAYSQSLTAVEMPPASKGHPDADDLRRLILEHFDMSLGTGLGPIQGTVFRIGHLGDFNALMLAGTLSGVEMGLKVGGVPHLEGGVQAALNYLADLRR
jgi:alanine-glyoxylate transaminase/serine-glyoxylate transaminase/serine-pyruvate transaminase